MHRFEVEFPGTDQFRFAELSGDFNPMHLDAVYARRTIFGEVVVHGVHLLLRTLDRLIAERGRATTIRSLDARFLAPVFPARAVSVEQVDSEPDYVRLNVALGQRILADITVALQDGRPCRPAMIHEPKLFVTSEPALRETGSAISARGSESLQVDPSTCRSMFPAVAKFLPLEQVAAVLATTRIVGMRCPGLHSLFSELHLRFGEHDGGAEAEELHYSVSQYDERFRRLTISLSGAGADGEILAFERPPPKQQPGIDELKGYIRSNEFDGARALVVGGSRGLGEIAAKLLAAGGADTVLTYNSGAAEARQIVNELRINGYSARALQLDVRGDIDAFVSELGDWYPTMLLYFATPSIFRQRYEAFSPTLFTEFADVYVSAMAKLFFELQRKSEIKVLVYPSTVAVEDTPKELVEYAAAKIAGENLCRFLAKKYAGLTVRTPRFPRLPTDQTATLFGSSTEEPVSLVLDALRARGSRSAQQSAYEVEGTSI